MGEIEKLLEELKKMKSEKKFIPNNKSTWSYIAQKDWTAAGFDGEEEAKAWIEDNPYLSL